MALPSRLNLHEIRRSPTWLAKYAGYHPLVTPDCLAKRLIQLALLDERDTSPLSWPIFATSLEAAFHVGLTGKGAYNTLMASLRSTVIDWRSRSPVRFAWGPYLPRLAENLFADDPLKS